MAASHSASSAFKMHASGNDSGDVIY